MAHLDLERFFDLAPDMLCIVSAAGALIRVNAAFQRQLGWGAAELAGQPFAALIHPDDLEATTREIATLAAGAPSLSLKNRYRSADGRYCTIQWAATRDPGTGALYLSGRGPLAMSDGQADLRAALEHERQALRISELHLAEAQRLAKIGSWELDLRAGGLWWSAEIYHIFEIDPARFGASYEAFLQMVHPDDRAAVDRAYTGSVAAKTPYMIDHRLLMPDGRVKHVHEQGETIYAEDGAPIRSIGTVQDITERRKAEEALRLKDQAIGSALNAVVITDADGRLIYVNPSFLRLWGYASEAEVLGRVPEDFADPESARRVIAQLQAQGAWQGELVARRKDGTAFDVLLSASSVRDDAGNTSNLVASLLDISEAKLLQARFLQAQKMESVGRLAGGVAHDFNNLLTVMKGYIDLAMLRLSPGDPLHYDLAQVNKAADSAASLTQQLLAFSRQQIIAPQVMSLNDSIRRMQNMLRRLIGEDIELRAILAENLATIMFDPGQFEQILMNLAVNARDAMPNGGKLTIETAHVHIDEDYIRYHAGVLPGDYVMIAVSDTGTGISAEIRAHLFEPFFTTKEAGKGTGLGLAMVYGAVSQNGGRIEVYSEPGQGTTFKVYLPQAQGESAQARAEPSAALPRGTQTIVLVEDDDDVRALAARLLGKQGYHVHAFRDGMEAIQAVGGMQEPLHLLITDVIMPKMNGRVLAEQIRALCPTIKVLFTSGYTVNVIVHHGVLDEGVEFLPKPYSVKSLTQRVSEVLGKTAT